VTAIKEIRQHNPEARILVLTSFGEEARVSEAIQAGALGYLLTHLTQKGSCQKSIKRGRMQNKPREGEKKWIKSFWICTAITSSPHFH
jgi:DNA-binding NarL/FixJ family response regulator